MARRPATKEPNLILDAMRFVDKVADKKQTSSILERHVRLHNKYAVCFNGNIALGHPIDYDLEICPQSHELLAALRKCGKNVVFATTRTENLRVQSKKQTVNLVCANPSSFDFVNPDAINLAVNNTLIEAITKVAVIVEDKNDRIVTSNVQITNNTCAGTNAEVILQAWHGFSISHTILLPKKAVKIVTDIKHNLTHIGTSETSITFYFDNGIWVKAYAPQDDYPDVNKFLEHDFKSEPVNEDFFRGINNVKDFSNFGKIVFFNDGFVYSKSHEGEGSKYQIGNLEDNLLYGYNGQHYEGSYFYAMRKYVTHVDFKTHPAACYVSGEGFRGIIHKAQS